jgi:glyoxylase-like metal-dependent hydrolase (beta-lactamase superfamily II)
MRGGVTRASAVLAVSETSRRPLIAVIDTGFGHHTNSLVAALAAEGIAPADVNFVLNTHAHVDHSHNNVIFTRANIYGSPDDRAWTREFYYALAAADHYPEPEDVLRCYPEICDTTCDRKILRKVLGIEKLTWDESRWGDDAKILALETNPLPEGITLLPTPGHAPHHFSFIINTNERPVLIAGDALLVRDEMKRSDLQIIPPYNLKDYKRSQRLIESFDGIIIPGHAEPFDNS